MRRLWHSATVGPESWSAEPESWRLGNDLAVLTTRSGQRRLVFWVFAVVGAGLVAGLAALHRLTVASPANIEIAVVTSAASGRNWSNFVEATRLAADERQFAIRVDATANTCTVDSPRGPIVFRWHPALGTRNIHRIVADLCKQPRPPLALIGASNSSLTQAIAEELGQCDDPTRSPFLLMTTATDDRLIDANKGRSVRFGFCNRYQAKTVVVRLKEFYAEHKIAKPAVCAILVRVLDDPFTVDLARDLEQQLQAELAATIVPPPESLRKRGGSAEEGSGAFWSLSTSTGGFDDPTDEEKFLARKIAAKIAARPDRQWVLALPMGMSQYRRLSAALESATQQHTPMSKPRAPTALVVLTGDSIEHANIREAAPNQLLAVPLIYFAHVNPLDETVASPVNRQIPTRSLNRDIVRALLATIPSLGGDSTPEKLFESLSRYVPHDGDGLFFDGRERRQGGGAILALPNPDRSEFDQVLPPQWRTTSDQGASN